LLSDCFRGPISPGDLAAIGELSVHTVQTEVSYTPSYNESFEMYIERMKGAVEDFERSYRLTPSKLSMAVSGASAPARDSLFREIDEFSRSIQHQLNFLWTVIRVNAVNRYGIGVMPQVLCLPL
jgi:hypothetical protein